MLDGFTPGALRINKLVFGVYYLLHTLRERYENRKSMYRPYLQVRSNSLITFECWTGESSHKRHEFEREATPPYNGTLSEHARKRLMSAMDILIQRNPVRRIFNPISQTNHDFNINFTTLTVSSPENITAREGYDELLSKYIRYMRDKYDLREYVWKAELQERGQLHYHIAGNVFIPWQVIRWKWNQVQKKAGLLDSFAAKYGHFKPNSTDIHAVEKVEDVYQYISKEISKNTYIKTANGFAVKEVRYKKERGTYQGGLEKTKGKGNFTFAEWSPSGKCISFPVPGYELEEAKIDGKLWDASEKLKIPRFISEIDDTTQRLISAAKRSGEARESTADRCGILRIKNPLKLLSTDLQVDYRNYICN